MKTAKLADLFIHHISLTIVRLLFLMIVVSMLLVNAVYLYTDAPALYRTSIYFYTSILLNALLLVLLSVFDKYISFDSNKSKYLITGIFAVYVLCE